MNAAQALARIGIIAAKIAAGDVSVVRDIAKLGLDLAPVDLLKQHLDDEARERGELAADAAELAKFGKTSPR